MSTIFLIFFFYFINCQLIMFVLYTKSRNSYAVFTG